MADKIQKPKTKEESLQDALDKIEKQFGKGAIMRLGDDSVQPVEAISTGCLTLDIALGIGGIPKGRLGRACRGNNRAARRRSRCIASRRCKSRAARRRSSTRSTR